jgi:hypothetical protein
MGVEAANAPTAIVRVMKVVVNCMMMRRRMDIIGLELGFVEEI